MPARTYPWLLLSTLRVDETPNEMREEIGKEVERGEAVGRHGIEVLGSGENGGFQLAGGWGGVVREETRIVVLGWELLGTVGSSVVRAA